MGKSIVTKFDKISTFSGVPAECEHHLIYGGAVGGTLRTMADEDGLVIYLAHHEHNMSAKGNIYQIHGNIAAEKLSKMLGQVAWEKHWIAEKYSLPFTDIETEAREAFRERYGQSWL